MSIVQDNEVISLRKVNKVLKYMFIIFLILTIIPVVLTIVYARKKIDSQKEIIQKTQVLHNLEAQLQKQNYIYQFGNMNISQFSIQLDENISSHPVKSIELQQNQLQQFNFNVIPGVQSLILDNNPLVSFGNNYFPNLWNFSIMTGALKIFENNYLISLKTLRSNQNIDIFSGNTMPLKQLKLNSLQFNNNVLNQLNSLQILGNHSIHINNNSLPVLNSFKINEQNNNNQVEYVIKNNTFGNLNQWCHSALSETHSWNISNNTLPKLTSFNFNGKVIINQLSLNNLPLLKQLTISGTNNYEKIYSLSINNNSMPNIEKISVNNFSLLKILSYNNFSQIKQLNISNNNIQSVQGNIFKQLTKANFSYNALGVFEISAPKLTVLDLSSNYILNINGIHCPSLVQLILDYSRGNSLNLNNATNLKRIKATKGSLKNVVIQNATNLKQIEFQQNKISSFNQSLLQLTHLNMSHNKLTTLNLNRSLYLTDLNVSHNHLTNIYLGVQNYLKRLDLSSNRLEHFDQSNYLNMNLLVQLDMNDNKLSNVNISAPLLLKLNITNNSLQTYVFNTPNLMYLYISNNNLSSLINLHFYNLQTLVSDNPIRIFSNNSFNLTNINTISFDVLEQFQNNSIDGHDMYDNSLEVISFTMKSTYLHSFKYNDLKFGRIIFYNSTVNMKQIINNDFTVRNEEIRILSPNLEQFNSNTIHFCTMLFINNTLLKSFNKNTMFNVSTLFITNSKLTSIKNNNILGLKNITLDNNLLDDSIVDDILLLNISGLEVISLKNNQGILNKTRAYDTLTKTYPQAKIFI